MNPRKISPTIEHPFPLDFTEASTVEWLELNTLAKGLPTRSKAYVVEKAWITGDFL